MVSTFCQDTNSVPTRMHKCIIIGVTETIGCYADTNDDRDLPYERIDEPPGGMTQDICTEHCFTKVNFTMSFTSYDVLGNTM